MTLDDRMKMALGDQVFTILVLSQQIEDLKNAAAKSKDEAKDDSTQPES